MCAELSIITLEIDGLPLIEGWSGHRTQAWLLRWIRRSAPELAAKLHDTNTRKPYTISPLFRDGDQGVWQLRITTLDPSLDDLLHDPPPFEHSGTSYPVREVGRETTSFAELLRRGESGILPGLHFWTPTAFRSQKMEINLPLPALLFGSLIQAWDSFSPLRLPLQLREVAAENVTIMRHSIHTRRITFPHRGGEGKRVGFVGRVMFGNRAEIDPVALRFLSALLHFAPYAGVGVGTAAGMGQAHLLQGWRNVLS